jgi:uncharacterized membrane protein
VATRRTPEAPDHDVRRSYLRERIRTGLWFIPLLAVLVAWAVSTLMHRLDHALGGDRPGFLAYDGDASQAAEVLSTIAGSTLTFTGIVFSITAVALQLGSSQFSPRALRNFLRDRGTQWALGLLVATFTYSLLTLRYVDPDTGEGGGATPGLSVTLALILVISSLVAFVFFVNHLAQSIRVVSIIERVAAETREAVRETMPLTEPTPLPALPERPPDQLITWDRGPGALLGYDEDDLVEVARTSGSLIRLIHPVGDFMPSRAPIVEVWHVDERHAPIEARAVLRRIGGGIERTMAQDPMFGFRQLVDIAEKALSPAINDPTTAVQSIDRLHDLLRRVACRPQHTGAYADADGVPRLIVPVPTWEDIVQLACDEIRHYGSSSLQVVRRMQAMFDDLLTVTSPDKAGVVHHQIALLDRAIDRTYVDPDDRAAARQADYQGLGS